MNILVSLFIFSVQTSYASKIPYDNLLYRCESQDPSLDYSITIKPSTRELYIGAKVHNMANLKYNFTDSLKNNNSKLLKFIPSTPFDQIDNYDPISAFIANSEITELNYSYLNCYFMLTF